MPQESFATWNLMVALDVTAMFHCLTVWSFALRRCDVLRNVTEQFCSCHVKVLFMPRRKFCSWTSRSLGFWQWNDHEVLFHVALITSAMAYCISVRGVPCNDANHSLVWVRMLLFKSDFFRYDRLSYCDVLLFLRIWLESSFEWSQDFFRLAGGRTWMLVCWCRCMVALRLCTSSCRETRTFMTLTRAFWFSEMTRRTCSMSWRTRSSSVARVLRWSKRTSSTLRARWIWSSCGREMSWTGQGVFATAPEGAFFADGGWRRAPAVLLALRCFVDRWRFMTSNWIPTSPFSLQFSTAAAEVAASYSPSAPKCKVII